MRSHRAVSTIAVLMVAGGAGGASGHAPAADDAVIAYEGGGHLLLVHPDGTDRRTIVPSGVADRSLAWSHDGARIAYTAGRAPVRSQEDAAEIRVVAADGTAGRLVTRGPYHTAQSPTWSPDDRRIAFQAWSEGDWRWSMYVVGSNGKGTRRLTRGSGSDYAPDWSPDGRWIAFERYVDGDPYHVLMVVHPDGTGLHRVARLVAGPQCICADWSPNGSKIAYQASRSVATQRYPEVYVMNANGTGRTRLTNNRTRDENPDWSPDGSRIAFYSERYSTAGAEIMTMNADGSGVTRVTRDSWYSALPRWQP